MQMPPQGLSRRERRDWYRQQRDTIKDAIRAGYSVPEAPVEARIARFRRAIAGNVATMVMLAGINIVTMPRFPWAIFPILGMSVGLMRQLGSLWGDGVSMKQIFFGPNRQNAPAIGSGATPGAGDAASLVPQEILDGPHGTTIRRATSSRQVIADLLKRMNPSEREMLPADIEATVTALVERVASVAMTLHRLDSEANGANLGSLDARLETLKRESDTSEQQRRVALLERQRTTLRDLLDRRSALSSQLESASLALENLKLDLVRFRSAGVSSALDDVTSATREARAVSRDIGHMLEAADEVRRL
jgi:serine/threonine-protein kinase